jgi:hypothetical protein
MVLEHLSRLARPGGLDISAFNAVALPVYPGRTTGLLVLRPSSFVLGWDRGGLLGWRRNEWRKQAAGVRSLAPPKKQTRTKDDDDEEDRDMTLTVRCVKKLDI